MKSNFFYFILLLTINTILLSCTNSDETNSGVERAKWLIGEWQNNSMDGDVSETWEKKNDSTYLGKSYLIMGADTVSSESITLAQIGKQLFYIPIVKRQNEGLPVKFMLTSSTNTQLVFENPTHEFPQKISYSQVTADSLLAEISGIMNGTQQSQKFAMARIK